MSHLGTTVRIPHGLDQVNQKPRISPEAESILPATHPELLEAIGLFHASIHAPDKYNLHLRSRIQHVFNEDSVSSGGVIHQHVGDGPNEAAILQNGRTGHSLNNAAGHFQQL